MLFASVSHFDYSVPEFVEVACMDEDALAFAIAAFSRTFNNLQIWVALHVLTSVEMITTRTSKD
jgi:hypothetical protein